MASRPPIEPRPSGADARAEDADSLWVRSLLLTWPGKTYRIDSSDEATQDAARDALAEAARTLTDRVIQDAARDHDADRNDPPTPGPS